ncbi:MAG: glucose-6-phosphate isomerase [Jiangellaceae bacterium]|nr:glucose-6-phosphate isomerase [Jiangellaceae bacterium]
MSGLAVSARGVDETLLGRLVADRVASRLGAGDATLWGPAAEEEAAIRLGWVRLHETSRPLLAELDALTSDVRAARLDRVVLCGMGGSSLAPEVITRTAGVELTVLDTTDPGPVRDAVEQRLDRTVVVVSSKSGTTVETDGQRRAFDAAFRAAGIDPSSRFVVVTDPGSALADLAASAGYRRVFLADPSVGGRYSALTAFGLVPSALAGVDVSSLLDEAAQAAPDLFTDDPENPALVLAAALGGGVAHGRDKVALADAGSGIVGFADWAEQLVAESTGKDGTGVLPVVLSGPDEPELQWGAADVLCGVLGSAPVSDPGVTLNGPLGAQFLLWECATAVAGRVIGINPFDQPDVESAKKAARGLLDSRPTPELPAFVDGAVEVRGSDVLLDGANTADDAVAALLAQLPSNGYLAVMAYLDREGPDAALADVRRPLAQRTGRPVTFGWGPRFLHSTGQYHKGGSPTGVFLQITGASSEDLPIPDLPFSFGELIAAQAAGDAQVLAGHGRPVLRLHLTDRAAGVARLLEVLR